MASNDSSILSVLSSKYHVLWAAKAGGLLEDRKIYTKSEVMDTFPFPIILSDHADDLSIAGEDLDAHRKRVLAEHPDLTLTGLYNTLEKIKAGTPLTAKDEDIKQRGLVLILRELHDEIDRLTAEAYGWPVDLPDEEILARLVALNAERAREEAAGLVRWLRPEYQIPRFGKAAAAKTGELDLAPTVLAIDAALPAFPTDAGEAALAVEAMLAKAAAPMTAAAIARSFKRGGKRVEQKVAKALATLVRYGHVAALDGERYLVRRAA